MIFMNRKTSPNHLCNRHARIVLCCQEIDKFPKVTSAVQKDMERGESSRSLCNGHMPRKIHVWGFSYDFSGWAVSFMRVHQEHGPWGYLLSLDHLEGKLPNIQPVHSLPVH